MAQENKERRENKPSKVKENLLSHSNATILNTFNKKKLKNLFVYDILNLF